MRVLLLHTNLYDFGQLPRTVESQRGLNPPITLAYVAAVAKKANHTVRLIDMDAEGISFSELPQIVKDFHPNIVGFSVMLNNFIIVLYLSRLIKKIDPSITIVLGGIMVNLYPKEILQHPCVDIAVRGECEESFPELLDALENNQPLDNIQGLVFKNQGTVIVNPESPLIQNLDSVPFPARELLHNEKYTSVISRKSPVTILFSARGCPYNCTFCSKPSFWHCLRFASSDYVCSEFQSCADLGIKEIMVYDDVFTANKRRAIEICKKLIDLHLDLTWDIRTRVDMINTEVLQWLCRAGCNRVNYGVESGDPLMLKRYKKGFTLPQVQNAFALTKKSGLETLAYFMIGGPDETVQSINHTYQLMLKLNPDYIHLTYVIPYPKTELFELMVQRGLVEPDIWSHLGSLDSNSFPMFDKGELTRDQIFKYVKKGYRLFYYRPQYILGRLKHIRSLEELWHHFKAALLI